ncbi:MAG: hypothetical protein ACFFB3_09705, partial [Candidatus Hodarchaeota archaeon]
MLSGLKATDHTESSCPGSSSISSLVLASQILMLPSWHPEAIILEQPNTYEAALKKAYVIADFQKRKQTIQKQIKVPVIINDEL